MRGVPREVLRGVSFSRSRRARRTGSSASRAAASRTTAYAALRYLPANGRITGGHVHVDGDDVTAMSTRELREFRATQASMVYQDPGSALNPALKIGPQVIECFTLLGQSKARGQRQRAGRAEAGAHRRPRRG